MIFVTDQYATALKARLAEEAFPAAAYVKWTLRRLAGGAKEDAQGLLWLALAGYNLEDGEAKRAGAQRWSASRPDAGDLRALFAAELLTRAGALDGTEVRAWARGQLDAAREETEESWRAMLTSVALAALAGDDAALCALRDALPGTLNGERWREELEEKAARPGGYNRILDELDELALLLTALSMQRAHDAPGSLTDRLGFMLPYVRNPYRWPYERRGCTVSMDRFCMQLAGALGLEEARRLNDARALETRPLRMGSPVAPLLFLDGHESTLRPAYFSAIGQNVRGYSHIK